MLKRFFRFRVGILSGVLACTSGVLVCTSTAQTDPDVETVHPNLLVQVQGLPSVVTKDTNASSIAKAAVSLVLSGSKLSCAPDSEVDKVIEANAGSPLSTLIGKISGTACTSSGQIHKVVATYFSNGEIHGDALIQSVMQGKPLVLEKQDGVYVLYGVIYDEHLHSSGRRDNVIRELLLIDPRYPDKRRLTSFVRGRDDFTDITGVASVTAK
jgi:hypothetical protein